nr:hypothetical protein [Photorhabdus temperata]
MSLLTVAGNVVGAVLPTGNVLFNFKQKKVVNTMVDTLDKVSKTSATQLEVSAHDLSTRELIPMLPDAEQTKAFTHNVGEVTSQQRQFIEARRVQIGKENLKARWAGKTLERTPRGEPEK